MGAMEQQIPGKWVQVYIAISEGQIQHQLVFNMGHGTWDMGYGQFAIKPHRFRSRGNKRLKLKMIDFNTIGRLFVGLII